MRYLPFLLAVSLLSCSESAPEKTQDRVKEEPSLRAKAQESIDELSHSLKDRISIVQKDLKKLVGESGKISEEKINEVLADLEKAEPALEEAGFELRQVAAEIGLNPGVIVYFRQNKALSEASEKELLEKYKDSSTTSILLKSLFYVYNLEFSRYQVREAILYVEALPKLRVMLEKK